MLEVGAELNELVATQVMAWHLATDKQHWLSADCTTTGFRRYQGKYCPECATWEPSDPKRLDAAWVVVEKLQSMGFRWTIKSDTGFRSLCSVWRVTIDNFDFAETPHDQSASITADTLPHAICLVALEVCKS